MLASTAPQIYAMAAILVTLALALVLYGIRLVKVTRHDPRALGPLEVIGSRRWRDREPGDRGGTLDAARPAGATPLAAVVAGDDVSPEAVTDTDAEPAAEPDSTAVEVVEAVDDVEVVEVVEVTDDADTEDEPAAAAAAVEDVEVIEVVDDVEAIELVDDVEAIELVDDVEVIEVVEAIDVTGSAGELAGESIDVAGESPAAGADSAEGVDGADSGGASSPGPDAT